MKDIVIKLLTLYLLLNSTIFSSAMTTHNDIIIPYITLQKRKFADKSNKELIFFKQDAEKKIIQEKNKNNSCIRSKYFKMCPLCPLFMLNGMLCYASPCIASIFCGLMLNITRDIWNVETRRENENRNTLERLEQQKRALDCLLKKEA